MSNVQSENWTRPDELLRHQIKQQKIQKLQKRLIKPNCRALEVLPSPEIVANPKRNNPFSKSEPTSKRIRRDLPELSEETLFELIHNAKPKQIPNVEANDQSSVTEVVLPVHNESDEETQDEKSSKVYQLKTLPVDWSIKSKVRILTRKPVIGTMKSSEEASGLTAFVRCLNMKSTRSRLDISDHARFHQNVMYFQYPNLPWLNLIQRNAATNNSFQLGEDESKSLIKDWEDSAYNLFQLLRTLQCPYFYMLANHFSILFRAAGIGGRWEMHAIVTPTTRGFRQTLKNDDIEFEIPLKSANPANISTKSEENVNEEDDEEEEEDEIEFLESLGVEASQIIFKEDIKKKRKEAEDDNGDVSTIIIEGHECQRFFNFLLNDAKSIIAQVGRLAGIPPTLISPVAFHGGSLRKQSVKTSKLRNEGTDFYSIELRGSILPHTIHTLCSFLTENKNDFSLTMTNNSSTVAFTKSSRKLMENLNTSKAAADHYFGRENLSDCGLENEYLEMLTRVDEDAVNILETLQYSEESGGFTIT